jgi:hypothetical protein
VTGLPAELNGLAAEFPDYDFATQQTWDGRSIIATRREGCAQPGLYAVVTRDPDEMRRALLEHELGHEFGHERPACQEDAGQQP